MEFEIVGPIAQIEVIAAGPSIRDLADLRRKYGRGRWRKLKGIARVRISDGRIVLVELHWYEPHGIGKRELRIKDYVDE